MTAPTPSPEEFANAMAATRLEAPHFICPECGPGGCADEDGCCTTCGATTFMSDAEWLVKRDAALLAPLRAEVERLTRERDEATSFRTQFYGRHGEIQAEIANVVSRADRAEAENARLRAFVQLIGNFDNYAENGCSCGVFRGCDPNRCIYAEARALAPAAEGGTQG